MLSCLACTVRGCGRPLEAAGRALACAAGHSFDIARAGYINLLQPQDRRSLDAGDAPEAVAARGQLLTQGIGQQIVQQVTREAESLALASTGVVIDLGAGTGELLASICHRTGIDGIGIDLSVAAMERAARCHPSLTWVVANADRRLPVGDGCATLVVSMHGRRNPSECARVLTDGGRLFVIVPGVDDLRELRTALGGRWMEQDRVPGVLAEHTEHFHHVRRITMEERHRVNRATVRQLLRATYRGERRSAAATVDTIDELDVTLSSDLLVFEKR
jgi:23S rRNA (guanine745-N1)-methyltransferase